jgi:predicted GNAT family acetyltransferase
LVDTLARLVPGLAGVDAVTEVAKGFAAAWCTRTGTAVARCRVTRLYRLGELTATGQGPAGRARTAGPDDRALLLTWFHAFAREVAVSIGSLPTQVDDRLSYGGAVLWEVAGEPVAMAVRSRAVAGAARVGMVYTPPYARRQGYAGAATEAVTRDALAHGAAEVLLFADVANPTSTRIYQRLGYRPVHDRVGVVFAGANHAG